MLRSGAVGLIDPMSFRPTGCSIRWALNNSRWKKALASFVYERRHLKNAVCLHAFNRAEMISMRRYGLTNPVAVVPNGVHVPILQPRTKSDERTILFLGRIHKKKGVEPLLSGWMRAEREVTNKWRLVIAGWDDSAYASSVKRLVREYSCRSNIEFVGPKYGDEKRQLLSSADAFILPSFSEGLPIAVLEAWSYGLPVIMTDHCNIPEGFALDAAIRVSPDSDSVYLGLKALISLSDEDRIDMGLRGRKLVEMHFAWPKIAAQIASVYSWILHGGDRPSFVYPEA